MATITRFLVFLSFALFSSIAISVEQVELAPFPREQTIRASANHTKVAITRFHVENPLQVEDIANIWEAYPLELMRRLEATGNVMSVGRLASLLPGESPASPANRDIVRRIAEQTGGQFVISGTILDASFGEEILRPYAEWQGGQSGRRFELGLWWNSLAAGMRPEPMERRFEVEILLYDASGTVLARHRHNGYATGFVTVGRNKAFASVAFYATPFGQTVEQVLNAGVETITRDLALRSVENSLAQPSASINDNPHSPQQVHDMHTSGF